MNIFLKTYVISLKSLTYVTHEFGFLILRISFQVPMTWVWLQKSNPPNFKSMGQTPYPLKVWPLKQKHDIKFS